jgi:hypothetical protein
VEKINGKNELATKRHKRHRRGRINHQGKTPRWRRRRRFSHKGTRVDRGSRGGGNLGKGNATKMQEAGKVSIKASW